MDLPFEGSRSLAASAVFVRRIDRGWRGGSLAISGGRIPERTGPGRPTPLPNQVAQIEEDLSEAGSHNSVRDYLCARWMSEVGLRRSGVASLSLQKLSEALRVEGFAFASSKSLDRASYAERVEVRQFLVALSAAGTEHLSIGVVEKGRPETAALVPLLLFEATLEFVWDQRAQFLTLRRAKGTPSLWVSHKTLQGMTSKAIGDRVKIAFNRCRVEGSGQRLRAAFAEKVMWQTYVEARTRDPEGLLIRDEDILHHVAERLRHAGTRSLKSYLNRAKRLWRELGLRGQSPSAVGEG